MSTRRYGAPFGPSTPATKASSAGATSSKSCRAWHHTSPSGRPNSSSHRCRIHPLIIPRDPCRFARVWNPERVANDCFDGPPEGRIHSLFRLVALGLLVRAAQAPDFLAVTALSQVDDDSDGKVSYKDFHRMMSASVKSRVRVAPASARARAF